MGEGMLIKDDSEQDICIPFEVLLHSPIRATEKQYNTSGIKPRLLTFDVRRENSLWQAKMGLCATNALGSLCQSLASPFQYTSGKGWNKFLRGSISALAQY